MDNVKEQVSDFKWYTIRCATNREEEAIQNFKFELEQENLTKYISEFHIPREKTTYMKNNKKTKRTRLLMPGYVMAKMIPNAEVVKVAKRTNYIAEILSNNGVPTAMKDTEVSRMIQIEEDSQVVITLYEGQQVKVIDGPFSDFIGTVTGIDSDKKRVKLIVSVFKRETPIELGFDQIEY